MLVLGGELRDGRHGSDWDPVLVSGRAAGAPWLGLPLGPATLPCAGVFRTKPALSQGFSLPSFSWTPSEAGESWGLPLQRLCPSPPAPPPDDTVGQPYWPAVPTHPSHACPHSLVVSFLLPLRSLLTTLGPL